MKRLLKDCATIFDRCPQPFGIVRVVLKEDGTPTDAIYEYLNPAMASVTDQSVEDLLHKAIYELWSGDLKWLHYFYLAAYHGRAHEFEAVSPMIEQFQNVVVFPIRTGYCGFLLKDVTTWVSSAQITMDNASTAIFFMDTDTQMVYLTPHSREVFNLELSYCTLQNFIEQLYCKQDAAKLLALIDGNDPESRAVFFEGRRDDGTWIQLSIGYTERADEFAYGIFRDITRTKEAEIRSMRRMDIIDSLSRENFSLYLVNLDKDTIELYRIRDNMFNPLELDPQHIMPYSAFLTGYVSEFVAPDDAQRLLDAVNPDALLKRIASGIDDYSISYKRIFEDKQEYVEMRVIRLKDSPTEVVLAGRNINDEILEQLTQKAALQDALALAKHASEAKSTFLTNMSHDFRTPMNSITGFANIALDNLSDTDKVCDCLDKIVLSSEHLLDLINDVLDVSRIESGKMSLSSDEVDLEAFLNDLDVVFSGQATEKNIHFSTDASKISNKFVFADKLRLNQILMNIIGNAFKFTRAGGSISVKAEEGTPKKKGYGTFYFTIADTGCGMSPEFLTRIFNPFERDGSNAMSHAEGTGLGTTIAKNLVTLFGGTIDVESEEGKGTTFSIYLPLKLADPTSVNVSKKEDDSYKDFRFDGLRALVIDDDELSREVMTEILKKYGFTVEEGMDGYEAVQMVSETDPYYYDVIIMDIRMPKMNGDEACKLIRNMDRPDLVDLPIIAATADALEEGHRMAREAGMTAHTTKPIKTHDLMNLLARCLLKTNPQS